MHFVWCIASNGLEAFLMIFDEFRLRKKRIASFFGKCHTQFLRSFPESSNCNEEERFLIKVKIASAHFLSISQKCTRTNKQSDNKKLVSLSKRDPLEINCFRICFVRLPFFISNQNHIYYTHKLI